MAKHLKSKELKNLEAKRRYAYIVNLTGDPSLARKLRYTSDTTLLAKYGVRVKREIPAKEVLKDDEALLNKLNIQRNVIQYEYYSKIKGKPKRAKTFKEAVKQVKVKKLSKKEVYNFQNEVLKSFRPELDTEKQLLDQWRYWSQKDSENMPQEIRDIASSVNLYYKGRGFDPDSKYGFAVVFTAFMNNITVEEAIGQFKVDKFSDGNFYMSKTAH